MQIPEERRSNRSQYYKKALDHVGPSFLLPEYQLKIAAKGAGSLHRKKLFEDLIKTTTTIKDRRHEEKMSFLPHTDREAKAPTRLGQIKSSLGSLVSSPLNFHGKLDALLKQRASMMNI